MTKTHPLRTKLAQVRCRGQVIKTVPESQIVETLIEEAMKLAEAAEPSSAAS